MKKQCALLFAFLMISTISSRAVAEHFDVDLSIDGPKGRVDAPTDPYDDKDSSRLTPEVHVPHGETFVFQFFMTSVYPHGLIKQVTVHYFVVPQKADDKEEDGKKPAKPNDEGGESKKVKEKFELDGKFLLDFKPKGKVGLRQRLSIDVPGRYLVRVQSEGSGADHEHFSQIFLIID